MTAVLLVGSRAMKYWFADAREPANDFDFLIDAHRLSLWGEEYYSHYRNAQWLDQDLIQVELNIGGTIGFDNTRYKSVELLLDSAESLPVFQAFGLTFMIASPEMLMVLKRSHVCHRHNWFKHIADYTFLKSKGISIPYHLDEALVERTKERNARGDFKIPGSLATSNRSFFQKSESRLRRKFEHDDLHLAVMYHDAPLFSKAKHDHSKAMLNLGLFESFSFEDKCNLAREEAYVIGLERLIIPSWFNQYTMHMAGILDTVAIAPALATKAYRYALMRLSTDLTSGWFRDFVIENHQVLAHPNKDYVADFMRAFESGQLKFKNGPSVKNH